MHKKKSILFSTILLSAIYSCKTPQEKLMSLYKKHPELQKADTNFIYRDRIVSDTIVVAGDTIVVEKKDTIYDTEFLKIYITKDSVKVIKKPFSVIVHDTIHDSIPVIQVNNVPVVKKVEVMSDWVRMLISILCGAIIVLLIIKRR